MTDNTHCAAIVSKPTEAEPHDFGFCGEPTTALLFLGSHGNLLIPLCREHEQKA